MPASPSRPDRSAIVARLRAAGCVFAEDEARLLVRAAAAGGDLAGMVDRRAAGEPLEYVLGWAEFRGLRIAVEPGVFVPRRRTGLVVREAVRLARRRLGSADSGARGPAVVVDLCCGSGALGVAIATELGGTVPGGTVPGGVELHAADVDPVAVRCARRNLAASGAAVYQGDLYDALPGALRGRIDLLVANVPYVPSDAIAAMPPEARDHEPRAALDGGTDGLDVLRRVAGGAPRWLAPAGHLLVETSREQAPAAVEAFERAGLRARLVRDARLDATAVVGARPGP